MPESENYVAKFTNPPFSQEAELAHKARDLSKPTGPVALQLTWVFKPDGGPAPRTYRIVLPPGCSYVIEERRVDAMGEPRWVRPPSNENFPLEVLITAALNHLAGSFLERFPGEIHNGTIDLGEHSTDGVEG